MPTAAYSQVGPYRHGVWLVVLPNGAAGIMNRGNLPAYRPGTKYYWLGADPKKAADRLWGALSHLGLDVSTVPDATGLAPAFRGRIVGVSGDFGAPGGSGPKPLSTPSIDTPTVPNAQYGQGPLGGVADAISGTTDFLKLISWIFHPLNIMRAVEFLTGIAMMGFGLSTLLGVMRRGRATHRTTLGMMFGGWRQGRRDRAYQNARRRARAPSQTTRTGNPQTYTPRP